MTSTMVECLQGIQTAKEATAPDKNGSGNPAIVYGHFTRADDAHTKIRYVLKDPIEALLLAMTNQQMTSSVIRHLRTAERITKSHPIGSERFWSVCNDNFEMRNLYAKNIMFACSLPTSTSTWRSEHRNGPAGYMSGELKSENIKYRKAPTRRSHYPAKDPQSSHHIQPNPRKIHHFRFV
jgi:hypothetical protein